MLTLTWGGPVADSALTATAISPGNFVVGDLISQAGKATTQIALSITVPPAGFDPTRVYVGAVRDINGTLHETPINIGSEGSLIQPLPVADPRISGPNDPVNIVVRVDSTFGPAFRTIVINANDTDSLASNSPIVVTSIYKQAQ